MEIECKVSLYKNSSFEHLITQLQQFTEKLIYVEEDHSGRAYVNWYNSLDQAPSGGYFYENSWHDGYKRYCYYLKGKNNYMIVFNEKLKNKLIGDLISSEKEVNEFYKQNNEDFLK